LSLSRHTPVDVATVNYTDRGEEIIAAVLSAENLVKHMGFETAGLAELVEAVERDAQGWRTQARMVLVALRAAGWRPPLAMDQR
jgi:hypothetical protein